MIHQLKITLFRDILFRSSLLQLSLSKQARKQGKKDNFILISHTVLITIKYILFLKFYTKTT